MERANIKRERQHLHKASARLLNHMIKKKIYRSRCPKVAEWTVEIYFLNRSQIKKTNRRFRKKNIETDVLSFSSPEPYYSDGNLGAIAICQAIARQQAREHGHSMNQELNVLVVHGLLHLLGFDHEKSKKAETEMKNLELKLLKWLQPGFDESLISRQA